MNLFEDEDEKTKAYHHGYSKGFYFGLKLCLLLAIILVAMILLTELFV